MPRVVARVNNPKNEWMFNELWGVDVAVSTPHLITALVQEAVSVGSFVRLLSFEGGKAKLAEVTLADGLAGRGQGDRRARPPSRRHRRGRRPPGAGGGATGRHHDPGRRRGDRAGHQRARRTRSAASSPATDPPALSGQQRVGRVEEHGVAALLVGDALRRARRGRCSCRRSIRRPVNSTVRSPVPSLTTTSSAGVPDRGVMRIRVTSPPTRTGVRSGRASIRRSSLPAKRSWSRAQSRSSTEARSRLPMSRRAIGPDSARAATTAPRRALRSLLRS